MIRHAGTAAWLATKWHLSAENVVRKWQLIRSRGLVSTHIPEHDSTGAGHNLSYFGQRMGRLNSIAGHAAEILSVSNM